MEHHLHKERNCFSDLTLKIYSLARSTIVFTCHTWYSLMRNSSVFCFEWKPNYVTLCLISCITYQTYVEHLPIHFQFHIPFRIENSMKCFRINCICVHPQKKERNKIIVHTFSHVALNICACVCALVCAYMLAWSDIYSVAYACTHTCTRCTAPLKQLKTKQQT